MLGYSNFGGMEGARSNIRPQLPYLGHPCLHGLVPKVGITDILGSLKDT